jgi:Cohesin domain
MAKRNFRMIERFVLVLTCFLSGAVAVPNASSADGIVPPVLTAGSDTVHVGDIFTIPISIASVDGLTSFQFDLAFNPTIITALPFITGLPFTDTGTDFETAANTGGGSLTGITGFFDNTTGLLSGIADSISGLVSGNGLTPSGVIVDIQFQALAVGISPLTLSNAFLTDNGAPLSSANGDFLLQNGQVTVIGPAAVPEPGTLVLLAVAFGGLAVLRLRCG